MRPVVLLLLLAACSAAPSGSGARSALQDLQLQPDVAISAPPYDQVDVSWKHRLAQPFAYLEATGSYAGIGQLLGRLSRLAEDQGLEVSGPPFALYYDDPGLVPIDRLRMRACLPLEGPLGVQAPVAYDVLDSTTVVYAFVAGPYPDVPRSYPALFAYLRELGWREAGPVRESYLVNPAEVADFSQLVTEVQIPAESAR